MDVLHFPTQRDLRVVIERLNFRCTHPQCNERLEDTSVPESWRVAYISAKWRGHARYIRANASQNLEDASNLVLLCAQHYLHVENPDNPIPAKTLRQWKSERELRGALDLTDASKTPQIEYLPQKRRINPRRQKPGSCDTAGPGEDG